MEKMRMESVDMTEKNIEKIKKDLYELDYIETQRLIENQRALDMLSDINNGLPKKIRRSKYRNYPFNSLTVIGSLKNKCWIK